MRYLSLVTNQIIKGAGVARAKARESHKTIFTHIVLDMFCQSPRSSQPVLNEPAYSRLQIDNGIANPRQNHRL
jgi:hypothetical protein